MNALLARTPLLPGQVELLARSGAFLKVQIDEALVRNASFSRHGLEVRDRLFVEPNGHRLLELRGVRILPRSAEVILLAHDVTYE